MSLQDLLHDAVPCAPTQMEVKTFQGIFKARRHDNMTHQGVEDVHSPHAAAKEKLHGYKTFYLHDDGALNFEKEVACVAKHFNISNNPTGGAREQKRGHLNWDTGGSTLNVNYAQHLGEVDILRDMRNHPMRSMDPMSAKIHILGFPALLAFLASSDDHVEPRANCKNSGTAWLGLRGCAPCLKSQTAIKEAGAEARRRVELYAHAAFVLVFTYWDVRVMNQFALSFGNDHDRVFRATSDPKFVRDPYGRPYGGLPVSIDPLHTIIVPYRSNYELDADLSQQTMQGRIRNKSFAFFFAGTFARGGNGQGGEGALRGPTMQAMQHPGGVIINRAISKTPLTETVAQETMLNFHRSAFCLAPTGDTATSRRVFEALAAGCVPVSLGPVKDVVRALPFHHSVDWSKTMLFAGSMRCLTKDNGAQAKLLATFLIKHHRNCKQRVRCRLDQMRRIGVEGYLHNLDYHQLGIVDALPREVSARLRWKEASSYGGNLTEEQWHNWGQFARQ